MLPFELYNPTKIHFGKESFQKISVEIPKSERILITYGGGSIKENGIYATVQEQLKDHETFEFGGIEPNPSLQTLLQALEIIKKEQITYLFAVGGGSVIDGTKFLASAAKYPGENKWDILSQGIRTTDALPFATLLTLPATGSESNSGAVVTNKDTGEKRGMGGPGLFPKVSFLNPEVVQSIPTRQLKNGIIDSFTHVLEQYITYPTQAILQDRLSESILLSIIETAPKLVNQPFDYAVASNYMWCSTMALNGLIQKGVPTDWATHMIGHELTALYAIDHAMTLAILMPQLWENQFDTKKEKLAQYAERVWSCNEGSIEEKAKYAIAKTKDFYHSLGIKTKLSDYTTDFEIAPKHVEDVFIQRNWLGLGEHKAITPSVASQIVRASF
jgi:NADP-dependent alcohol dehydrogenase